MGLQVKTIEINDEQFEVREIKIGEVLPILPRLEDPDQQQEAQLDIMRLCIAKDGLAMGEDVLDLGMHTYLQLAEEVMQINGLTKVGKD